jgi:hypothetical protein
VELFARPHNDPVIRIGSYSEKAFDIHVGEKSGSSIEAVPAKTFAHIVLAKILTTKQSSCFVSYKKGEFIRRRGNLSVRHRRKLAQWSYVFVVRFGGRSNGKYRKTYLSAKAR